MRARTGTQVAREAVSHRRGPSVVVLAAGRSTRFRGTKQLARLGPGTLVGMVLGAVPRALVGETVVVLGHRAGAVEKALHGLPGVRFVLNEDYRTGLASSIRAGISSLAPDAEGAMLLLADQPFVSRSLLTRMIRRFDSGSSKGKIVAAGYGRLVAPPVLFSRDYFDELESLRGDEGARSVISRHAGSLTVVKATKKGALSDVDTREDLEEARRLLEP